MTINITHDQLSLNTSSVWTNLLVAGVGPDRTQGITNAGHDHIHHDADAHRNVNTELDPDHRAKKTTGATDQGRHPDHVTMTEIDKTIEDGMMRACRNSA